MFWKIAILVAIVSAVWFGFRYLDRRERIAGDRRKVGERTLGERLRKATREKSGAGPVAEAVEETERCPTCKAFVSVEGIRNCGKPDCPY